jgi:hypothetical protein
MVNEHLGHYLQMLHVDLQLLGRADPGGIQLEAQVLHCDHEPIDDILQGVLEVGDALPFGVNGQHLGGHTRPAEELRLIF